MNRFHLIFKFLFDKNIPLKEKWWIIIPLIYIISPLDLIPAPILGFSFIDDAVVLIYLMSVVESRTEKYYRDNMYHEDNKKKDKYKENIVEDVEYEMKDDEDE